jgi:signal transduction histidine kinase
MLWQLVQPQLLEKDQHLEWDYSATMPEVYIDAERITQVISHLLTNASEYSSPRTAIYLDACEHADALVITVQDQGYGIDACDLTRIFTRYYQGQQQGTAKSGLGIGLSLCQEIVEQHQGQIGVVSQIGEGSTFTLSIPIEHK